MGLLSSRESKLSNCRPRREWKEDDAAVRQGVVDYLAFEGYETIEAADGNAGHDFAQNAPYDLLLLDLLLLDRLLPAFLGTAALLGAAWVLLLVRRRG